MTLPDIGRRVRVVEIDTPDLKVVYEGRVTLHNAGYFSVGNGHRSAAFPASQAWEYIAPNEPQTIDTILLHGQNVWRLDAGDDGLAWFVPGSITPWAWKDIPEGARALGTIIEPSS